MDGWTVVAGGLAGRRALVCGASGGIGWEAALTLARSGAHVIGLARRAERLDELVATIEAGGGHARACAADLDDHATLAASVGALLEDGPIHVLVNNATGPASGPLVEATSEAFLGGIQRHVLASQLLVQRLLPGMAGSRYGRIINIISTSVREPILNLGVSNTVRGAMAGWSKTLALELPPTVTINNVLPGFTETPRLASLADQLASARGTDAATVTAGWLAEVPAGRLGHPAETAAAVAFLASPAAAYIRGVSLAVDGGRTRSI